MKKLLFGLGVSKAGTTWLHNALSQNPGVGSIPRKEIHYFLRQYGGVDRLTDTGRMGQFAAHVRRTRAVLSGGELGMSEPTDPNLYGSPWDDDMAAAWAENGKSLNRFRAFNRTLEWYKCYLRGPVNDNWYRRLFDTIPDDKWATDFSTTGFLANDRGYCDMAEFAEETRALIILRDPIDRLWSHMKFHAEITRDLGNLHVWSAGALRDYAAFHDLARSSMYGDAITSLTRNFQDNKQFVIPFEELKTDPAGLFSRVQKFIDVPEIALPERAAEEKRVNVSDPMPLPRGLFAHIAGDFERDLERVAKLGFDFVEPWIVHAQAHARERPKADYLGARSLARRAINKVRADAERRAAYRSGGRSD